jgi:hypothetical protein
MRGFFCCDETNSGFWQKLNKCRNAGRSYLLKSYIFANRGSIQEESFTPFGPLHEFFIYRTLKEQQTCIGAHQLTDPPTTVICPSSALPPAVARGEPCDLRPYLQKTGF